MAPSYHYDIFAKNDDDDNDDDDCRQIPFNQSMNESINQLLKSHHALHILRSSIDHFRLARHSKLTVRVNKK